MQMYPGWSARDNYAVHKKRKRKQKKPTQPEEEEEAGEAHTPPRHACVEASGKMCSMYSSPRPPPQIPSTACTCSSSCCVPRTSPRAGHCPCPHDHLLLNPSHLSLPSSLPSSQTPPTLLSLPIPTPGSAELVMVLTSNRCGVARAGQCQVGQVSMSDGAGQCQVGQVSM